MTKKALITGISGQDAAYLAQYLLGEGYDVYGSYRVSSSANFWRLEELGIKNHPGLTMVDYDLTDFGSSVRLLERVEPDVVYNLAAQSFVGTSFDQPFATIEINGVALLTC